MFERITSTLERPDRSVRPPLSFREEARRALDPAAFGIEIRDSGSRSWVLRFESWPVAVVIRSFSIVEVGRAGVGLANSGLLGPCEGARG